MPDITDITCVSGHSHPHINCQSVQSLILSEGGGGCSTLAATFSSEIVVWRAYMWKPVSGFEGGISWWRIDSLQFSVVPQIEFSPFVMRGKKALMLENYSLEALDLLLTSAIGWKEKLFVIWTRKNLFLYVTLKILGVFLNSSTVYEGFSGMVAGLVCF